MPVGTLETRAGLLMSAEDNFEIILSGVGGHAARPHSGSEAMLAACATVMNLQSIVSMAALLQGASLHAEIVRRRLPLT